MGTGPISVAAAGQATDDGFTSYKAQEGNPPRTRWGDYGAAAVDGSIVWIAGEYVASAGDAAHHAARGSAAPRASAARPPRGDPGSSRASVSPARSAMSWKMATLRSRWVRASASSPVSRSMTPRSTAAIATPRVGCRRDAR
ncbi:hypothetical protein ASE25_21100 [Terrabacter sp. Root85]|nr:hypothetical protein ASE25_21100 [Terrabacter sp. Root85]